MIYNLLTLAVALFLSLTVAEYALAPLPPSYQVLGENLLLPQSSYAFSGSESLMMEMDRIYNNVSIATFSGGVWKLSSSDTIERFGFVFERVGNDVNLPGRLVDCGRWRVTNYNWLLNLAVPWLLEETSYYFIKSEKLANIHVELENTAIQFENLDFFLVEVSSGYTTTGLSIFGLIHLVIVLGLIYNMGETKRH